MHWASLEYGLSFGQPKHCPPWRLGKVSQDEIRRIVKGEVTYIWYSASSWNHLRSAQVLHNAHVLKLTVLPTQPHIHPQSELAIHAFTFPAIAGSHLPTPEGWKAELAWMAGFVVRHFTCPKVPANPTTNQAQCRATALIETNTLPLC